MISFITFTKHSFFKFIHQIYLFPVICGIPEITESNTLYKNEFLYTVTHWRLLTRVCSGMGWLIPAHLGETKRSHTWHRSWKDINRTDSGTFYCSRSSNIGRTRVSGTVMLLLKPLSKKSCIDSYANFKHLSLSKDGTFHFLYLLNATHYNPVFTTCRVGCTVIIIQNSLI